MASSNRSKPRSRKQLNAELRRIHGTNRRFPFIPVSQKTWWEMVRAGLTAVKGK